ncbi:MAG: 50S ribosomal protein L6 [Bacillota bacterium]
MSRIGKKPVSVQGVTVTKTDNVIKVKGPKGELVRELHPKIKVDVNNDEITLTRPDDTKESKALHGLTRSLLQNMVVGVKDGYSKVLDIIGVGYRAEARGNGILINVGYSHPIFFIPPAGITIEATTPTQLKVSGIDKELVGLIAAKIRSFKKPEPYKGKGIKYSNEVIIRKAGKTAGK